MATPSWALERATTLPVAITVEESARLETGSAVCACGRATARAARQMTMNERVSMTKIEAYWRLPRTWKTLSMA